MELQDRTSGEARGLGWVRFLIQFVLVALAYVVAQVPPVLALGLNSTGLALASVAGALGGIAMAWPWLSSDGALGAAFALRRPDSWPRALLQAGLAALAVQAWFQVGSWALTGLGMAPLDTSQVMDFVTQSPASLALWVVGVAWFAAGFGEEMLWRGFLFDRLMRLRGVAGRVWLAIAIQAIVFGLPHLYQGWTGVILTGVVGVIFGWLRTRTQWNLWPLIIAHGLVDTISMVGGYLHVNGL